VTKPTPTNGAEADEPARPLPRNLAPTRAEAPPTPEMIEERRKALAAKTMTATKPAPAVTPPTVRLPDRTADKPAEAAPVAQATTPAPVVEVQPPPVAEVKPEPVVAATPAPVVAAKPEPVAETKPAPPALPPEEELARPLPRNLTPTRIESPPTPEMLEARVKQIVTPSSIYVVPPPPPPGTDPPRPVTDDDDDDFKIM
jgi:hypothetical protein